ncbi:hypothetical protein BTA51_16145 [Hahella sp. CCB-MM4]|uniref:DUF3857 domain-containing transglutaminase family protein n=1 Tax=Hahella sp. (strain CCB-MM4) TaxID=1926491 RepID=UPI000B9C516C|nr:DUF3857 domain-containing protein [Hahella sp. CCB-MM4]OZG72270.1 hypothetical protein BTA51_16145 [Hahella sp. CCB-MM4]
MKFLSNAALILLVGSPLIAHAESFTSNGYRFDIEAEPSWVKSVSPGTPVTPAQGATNYLLVDRQFNAGKVKQDFYRYVEQPVNLEGLEATSKIEVKFNPEYEELVWHRLDVIRDGKVVRSLAPEDIQMVRKEEDLDQDMINGYVTSLIYLKGTRIGDTVDYSFSTRGQNPIFGDHFFTAFSLNWTVPVSKVSTRIVYPETLNLQVKHHRDESTPHTYTANNMKVLEWENSNIAAYYWEEDYPVWYEPGSFISVTDFNSWKDVVDWALPLYQTELPDSAEFRELVQRLKKLPSEEAVTQALAFAQDEIRYVGIEMGQNSHLPHSARETLENRYGDCKDKTLLLITILHALDIEAHPALVSWDLGKGVANYAPSPGPFDHVITMVDIHGKRYWLDPTRRFQDGGLEVLGYHNFGKALPIIAGTKDLEDMSLPESSLPRIETTENFHVIDYRAPVEHEIITVYYGSEADSSRRRFANSSLESISNDYYNYMVQIYPGLTDAGQIQTFDDKEHNKFTTIEKYRIANFFESKDNTLHYETYAYSLNDYLYLPQTTKRKGPIYMKGPIDILHKVNITYPEHIDMAIDNPRISEKMDELEYQQQTDYLDKTLSISHELKVNRDAIAASDVDQYVKAREHIRDELWQPYLLDDDPKLQNTGNALTRILDSLRALAAPEGEAL